MLPVIESRTVASISQLSSVRPGQVHVVVDPPLEPAFHGGQSSQATVPPLPAAPIPQYGARCPNPMQHPNASMSSDRPPHASDSDPVRTMIRQLCDVCHMPHWPSRGSVQSSDSSGILVSRRVPTTITTLAPVPPLPPAPHLSHPAECAARQVVLHMQAFLPRASLQPEVQDPRLTCTDARRTCRSR